MRIIIKTILMSMTLISLSSIAYAEDSASSDAKPHFVTAQKSVPQIDTSKCVQYTDAGWMNMADADGVFAGNVSRLYAPAQCPANYAVVKLSDYKINYGEIAPTTYRVRNTYDQKTTTCCPVVAQWVPVTSA